MAESQDRRASKKNGLVEGLRNPVQLRAAVLATVLAVGYGGIYLPLTNTVDVTNSKLLNARNQLKLAAEVEQLRRHFEQVSPRLPKKTDATEWMEFVLNGIRRSPMKLESFSPGTIQNVGSYQVISLTIRLTGFLDDALKFIEWIEANDRLLRINNLRLSPTVIDGDDCVNMDIVILGIIN